MNSEFFDALRLLEKEKNINLSELSEKIKNAIAIAIKKHYGNVTNTIIDLDIDKNIFSVAIIKNVVENVEDRINEISLIDARKFDHNAQIGYPVMIELDTTQFGRIAALSAKHVIKQGIRDAEKNHIFNELKQYEHSIVSAVVSKVDPLRYNASLIIGSSEVIFPRSEQIPNEKLIEGDVIKIYVSEVSKTDKGPKIIISRTNPDFIRQLFIMEIPEIKKGLIEIKSIVREVGSRTKISVKSLDPNIDPVGSCVGNKGLRINKIVKELNGEKVDVIKYSDDFVEYISNALAPAKISCVIADPSVTQACYVFVPNDQLSLAIGNRGQNVRLSAKLTGWKIDIKPEGSFDLIKSQIEQKQDSLESESATGIKSEILDTNAIKNDNPLFFNFDMESNNDITNDSNE